jgi:HPr kinase/phosphorylase
MFGVRSIRPDVRLEMVVTLLDWRPDVEEERTGLEESHYDILGIRIPHIEIHVRPGRDIARLVEVAALVQALKKMGKDPAREFNDRLIAFMSQQQPPAPEPTEPEMAGSESEEPLD